MVEEVVINGCISNREARPIEYEPLGDIILHGTVLNHHIRAFRNMEYTAVIGAKSDIVVNPASGKTDILSPFDINQIDPSFSVKVELMKRQFLLWRMFMIL